MLSIKNVRWPTFYLFYFKIFKKSFKKILKKIITSLNFWKMLGNGMEINKIHGNFEKTSKIIRKKISLDATPHEPLTCLPQW